MPVTYVQFKERVALKFKNLFTVERPAAFILTKTILKCVCPTHGDFFKTGSKLLGSYGCPKCAIPTSRKLLFTGEVFLNKANVLHNKYYHYARLVYTNSRSKVIITCPIHGDFKQRPSDHLQGAGCNECGIRKGADKHIMQYEEFVKKATDVHGKRYNYKLSGYVSNTTPATVECRVHGLFTQVAYSHLKGTGCPSCTISGFDRSKSGILYFLKIAYPGFPELYKLGITNRTVRERFSGADLQKIEVLAEVKILSGATCYKAEQELLHKYKEYRPTNIKALSSGNTELMTVNILEEVLQWQT